MSHLLRAFAAAALAAPLLAAAAGSQTVRPVTDCAEARVASVSITADGRRNPALDSAASHVLFWFRPAELVDWQSATVPVTVGRGTGIDVGTPRGDGVSATLLAAAHDAVAAAASEHALDAFAPDSERASAALVVHFGEAIGQGGSRMTRRVVCTASAIRGNPKPEFPAELQPELRKTQTLLAAVRTKSYGSGVVRAQFVVDSLGVVDPSTFRVLEATDPAFTREVRRVLPMMHYFPATIDGRPTAQAVEQAFSFEHS